MRLQRPRFSSKPEPDRAQDPCTARIGSIGHMTSTQQCPDGFNSASDTANPNKVSNLAATVDTRWGSMAWRTAGRYSCCQTAPSSTLISIAGDCEPDADNSCEMAIVASSRGNGDLLARFDLYPNQILFSSILFSSRGSESESSSLVTAAAHDLGTLNLFVRP
ncbi:hypothetical protein TIFTF001_021670 [Ficus carica]|uniref:Uncharacterized protein n=1 Tax=Ficus carica TaxID=3494 RepID=A0AA88AGC2_FICCA|nr:hypothetical protein TIFTF001_021670 [Ficus carica]